MNTPTLRLAVLLLLALAGCESTAPPASQAIESPAALGFSLRELPEATLSSIGLTYGLAVVKVGAAAERAGLRLGDVIYGVNQKRIGSVAEFSQLVAAQTPAGPLGLLVRRGKTDFYVAMEVGTGSRPLEGLPRRGRPSTDTLLRT
jgi:serine protease Do